VKTSPCVARSVQSLVLHTLLRQHAATIQWHEPGVLLMQLSCGHVPVDVAGDAHARVAQYPCHYLYLCAALQHMRRVEVPQLVRRERPDSSSCARPLQGLI
jgi:hypothetical protein